jgi:hypothetical protein
LALNPDFLPASLNSLTRPDEIPIFVVEKEIVGEKSWKNRLFWHPEGSEGWQLLKMVGCGAGLRMIA